ncbi:hypothetical protein GF312_01925 [Candidatus Poribacteria bacterium]|nr:hypothetical protein [Candidatus Poribacteria bacterium]
MSEIYKKIQGTLLSPCCFSDRPAMGNEVDTLDYIPGSAVRGILANAFLNNGNDANEDFRNIFCSDSICFPNLYPQHRDSDSQTYPIPLSIYTCKTKPGFINEPNTHGARDMLFENFDGSNDRRCEVDSDCGYAPLVPIKGFYNGNSQRPKQYIPDKLIITRTAVNSISNSALEASLHSQQELPEGSRLQGVISLKDDDLYIKLIEGLGSEELVVYAGRRRMGKIELNLSENAVKPNSEFLDIPKEEGFMFFTLTLLSDAIVMDELLRPVITLTPTIMKDRQIGFPEDVDITIVKAFCGKRIISGWHSVAKIFKPDDLAIIKGSTFLMRIEEKHKDMVKKWMEEILCTGIGLRRSEGFGQISISANIHIMGSRGDAL